MAYSFAAYTGNGSQRQFAVTFPFLLRDHVSVTVNNTSFSFVWINDGIVELSGTPANGAAIKIIRSSNRQARLSDYQDAQVLTEAQLDFDARQIFYVAQEAFDALAFATGVTGDMLRANNLSDVFDANASRLNIGAVNVQGDTMEGSLYLFGSPTVPNEAATKGYVDSVVGGVGVVTSFNTRTGAVVLTTGDVSAALGFTPVNKAGDTMTGLLVLSADPTSALHAVTKQYADSLIAGGGTEQWTFNAASNSTPSASAAISNAPAAFNDGLLALTYVRTGGVPVLGHYYNFAVTASSAGVDVARQTAARATTLAGGSLYGSREIVAGPKTNTGNWTIVGQGLSAFERYADQGIKRTISGKTSMGMSIQPETDLDMGDGTTVGFNTSFGITFVKSSAGLKKTWVPILTETDSVPAAGVHQVLRGGSSAGLASLAAVELWDNFTSGIDFRNATFNDTNKSAIWMAAQQSINFGPASRIFVDAAGNLTFRDAIVGIDKTLASLIAGAGGFDLAADHIFTGRNTFAKNDATDLHSVIIKSEANGVLATGGNLLATGYAAALDIRKTSLQSVEGAGLGGNVGAYIQHKVSGNATFNTVTCGIRVQHDTAQTKSAGSVNDAVAGYFSLRTTGADIGGFGIHCDANHVATGANSVMYGLSAELFRQSSAGYTVGCHIRTIGGGGYYDNDFAFLASPGGGSTKFGSVFAGGSAVFGSIPADRGLDLRYTVLNTSAISIPSNKKIHFDDGEGISQLFNSSTGYMEFANIGSKRVGLQMSNGVLTQWDGTNGSFGTWFFDAAGTQDSVMNVRSGSRTSAPANGTTINNWLVIKLDGTKYRLPLYL
jgi:hypothetical protein